MERYQVPYDRLTFGRKERSPDRYASSLCHTVDSKAGPCLIAVSVEIENPWHHAREYGTQISSSLVREFARSQSASNLIRFEQALKATNHLIKQAQEKLGTEIHCSVALLIGGEIHFAVVGRASLLLYRSDKLSDVVPNEEKGGAQFSSVTSGDLEPGEWVMLGDRSFAIFLRQIEASLWKEPELDPLAAAIIETAGSEELDYSGTLLRFQPSGAAERTILWDMLEPVTPIKLPKVSLPRFDLTKINTALSQVFAAIKTASLKIWQRVLELRTQAKAKAGAAEKVTAAAENNNDDPTPPSRPKISLPKLKIRWRWQYGAIAAFLVLLIFGVQTLVARVKAPQSVAAPATIADELVAITVGEREKFIRENYTYDRYAALNDEQKQLFAQALLAEDITTYLPSPLIKQLPEKIVAIDAYGESLAVIDATGQLWILENNQAVKIEQSLQIQSPRSLAAFGRDKIVVSDASGNIWLFDNSAAQPVPVPLPSTIASGEKDLVKYSGNLYIYDSSSRAVYRQSNFDRDLSGLSVAVKSSEVRESAKDMAVNGEIVLFSESGVATTYLRGQPTGLTVNLTTAKTMRLATVERNTKLHVIAAPLLYVIDTSGLPERRLLPLHSSALTDLALSEDGQWVWLALGADVYRVTI
jgi:hypothetical protein